MSQPMTTWKEIASYLGKSVRTVQRWEHLGLPIRRPNARIRSAVVTTSEELDGWLARCSNGRTELTADSRPVEEPAQRSGDVRIKIHQLAAQADLAKRRAVLIHDQIEQIQARMKSRAAARAS